MKASCELDTADLTHAFFLLRFSSSFFFRCLANTGCNILGGEVSGHDPPADTGLDGDLELLTGMLSRSFSAMARPRLSIVTAG